MKKSLQTIYKFMDKHQLQPGDSFVTYFTTARQAKHYVLILEDMQFIQNSTGKNINRPSIDEVAHMMEEKLVRVEKFTGNSYERELVLARAVQIEREGRKYWLALYNCEDFRNEVWTGTPSSRQANIGAAATGVIGLALIGIGHAKKMPLMKTLGVILMAFSVGTLLCRSINQSLQTNIKPSGTY